MHLLRNGFLSLAVAAGWLAGPRPATADDAELSPANMARCKAATVLVDLGKIGSGSGFLVHPCGLFATARHVVENLPDGTTVRLVLDPGQPAQRSVQARVVAVSEAADLALLKSDEAIGAEPLALSDDADLVELTHAVVFGYPFGKMLASGGNADPTISINAGRVSALRRDGTALESIQLDAAVNPGNSGGPVVGSDGKVLGLIVSGVLGSGVNFAVPAKKLVAMLGQPLLALRAPTIPFRQRAQEREFEVEILPTAPVPPDGEISISFGAADGPRRTFPAVRRDGKYIVKATPCDPAAAGPTRLRVAAAFPAVTVFANVDDCPFRAGNRELWLSRVSSIETSRKESRTRLVDREKDGGDHQTVYGAPTGLPTLRGLANDITLDLARAERVTVGTYDPADGRMPYDLTMTSAGKTVAAWHGTLVFSGAPAGLALETEPAAGAFGPQFFSFSMAMEEGLETLPLIDLAKDARLGSWERENGALATRADPAAWCELPLVPTGDYRVTVRFTPEADGNGELLLQLPVGKARALLHVGGEKCRLQLDLAGAPGGDDPGVYIPYLAKHKDFELTVEVDTSGDDARIVAYLPDNQPLVWSGSVKRLAAPEDSPVGPKNLAVGHRGLAMEVESVRLRVPDGGLRILRELPGAIEPTGGDLVAHWTMDDPVHGTRMRSSGGGVRGVLEGSPQVGVAPALLGTGAMKFDGSWTGFKASETPRTNYGMHWERTISIWFLPDAANARDQRQAIYAEGGGERGFTIYRENDMLWAGGWDESLKWKPTWLKAWNVTAGKWHHVALVLHSDVKFRDKALSLYVDGNEADAGWGSPINSHGPMVFGAMAVAPRTAKDGLGDGANGFPFVGLMDEVSVYNSALGYEAIHALAGARFEATAAH